MSTEPKKIDTSFVLEGLKNLQKNAPNTYAALAKALITRRERETGESLYDMYQINRLYFLNIQEKDWDQLTIHEQSVWIDLANTYINIE